LGARIQKLLGNDTDTERKEHEAEMLRLSKPRVWNMYIENNAELEEDINFEEFVFSVSEHTSEDVNKMTVFRFYSLLDHIKKKNKDNG